MRALIAMGLLALLLGTTACAGGSSSPQVPDCSVPAVPQMLYPMNHATGVPDGNFTMVLAFTVNPAMWGSPGLAPSAVSGRPGPLQPAPNPLPSPIASPPSGATLQGSAIGSLQPATQYAVLYSFQPPTGCVPPGGGTLPVQSAGSFTTQ
jgi:hypothetical protein